MSKVTIVGAGNVGATAAFILALQGGCDEIVLVDIEEGIPKGKALDIMHALPLFNSTTKVSGTKDYKDTENSDIIIITAGVPRKPGMSRDDLIAINTNIVNSVAMNAVKYSPKSILIIVTNPLDAMVYTALKQSNFPKERVIGMAGVLDSVRFIAHLCEETDLPPSKIKAIVLGTHGDTMVPLKSHSKMHDKPLHSSLHKEKLDPIVERVKNSGAEVVNYLKTGSAFVAPAASTVEMINSILKDEKKLLPCSCFLEGEYGYKDICLGVPAILGRKGIERIEILPLDNEEKSLLDKSADHVRQQIDVVKKIINK